MNAAQVSVQDLVGQENLWPIEPWLDFIDPRFGGEEVARDFEGLRPALVGPTRHDHARLVELLMVVPVPAVLSGQLVQPTFRIKKKRERIPTYRIFVAVDEDLIPGNQPPLFPDVREALPKIGKLVFVDANLRVRKLHPLQGAAVLRE